MTKENSDFKQYVNMIFKLARKTYRHNVLKRPDVQFDDVYSEGMLIYSRCLKEYSNSKGMKFSTYLYMNLEARLNDFYKCTMKPIEHYEDFVIEGGVGGKPIRYEETLTDSRYEENDLRTKDLMETAKAELSYEGYKVFEYILSYEWVGKKAKTRPSVKSITEKFGYTPEIVDSIMGEIKSFWNKDGWQVA